jgi:hypothetical protein
MSNYFYGQGKLYCAKRGVTGLPGALRWFGDVSDAKLALKSSVLKHQESYTGQRSTAKKIVNGKEATFDFTLMELSRENLAMELYGTANAIASGSITAEVLPLALVAGDRVSLKYMKVSTVVITDSASTPVTLDPAKYEVDATYGAITLLDVAGVTQPLKVAYTHAALDSVSVFSSVPEDIFIRYEGINLAEGGAPIIVELYKLNTEPLKELSLINSKFSEGVISADVLIDTLRPADAELGQFGRILQLGA